MKQRKIYLIIFVLFIIILFETNIPLKIIQKVHSLYNSTGTVRDIKVNFSTMKIPKNWYINEVDQEHYYLIGPAWSFLSKLQFMTIIKNEQSLKNNLFYLDRKFCTDSKVSYINSPVLFKEKDFSNQLTFSTEILSCHKNIHDNIPYIAYYNKGLMILIIIKPYEKKFYKQYIKFFKSLHFTVEKINLPSWL